jgi:hypothetical protein
VGFGERRAVSEEVLWKSERRFARTRVVVPYLYGNTDRSR